MDDYDDHDEPERGQSRRTIYPWKVACRLGGTSHTEALTPMNDRFVQRANNFLEVLALVCF